MNVIVEDVFCIWVGTNDTFCEFHGALNSFQPKIKFLLEISGTCISSLDLKIDFSRAFSTFSLYILWAGKILEESD